jgi:hypothetical protein
LFDIFDKGTKKISKSYEFIRGLNKSNALYENPGEVKCLLKIIVA